MDLAWVMQYAGGEKKADLRVPKTAYDPSYIHASSNHQSVRISSLYTEGLTPKIPRWTEQPGH